MPICCCVTTAEVIESWDLPVESEHDIPKRLSGLAPPKGSNPQEARLLLDAPCERHKLRDSCLRVGAVSIPPGTHLGLHLLDSFCENLIIISDVGAGPWQKWNEAHPEHQVKAGDEIIEVNGRSREHKDIIREMSGVSDRRRLLMMLIRRPVERAIRVPRSTKDEFLSEVSTEQSEGRSLGLSLHPVNDTSLFIDAIHDGGAVAMWNKNHKSQQVRVLDRIVEVNGISGTPQKLAEALEQPGDCELVLQTHLGTCH